jgi:hypothetical protein
VISGGADDDDDGGSVNDALNKAGEAAAARIDADDGSDDDLDDDDDGGDDDDDAAALEAGAAAAKKARQKAPAKADEPKEGEPVPWETHKKLRDENADYRKRWQPFEKAFGELDDESRTALLDAAPALGGDLAYLARRAGLLSSEDRRWLADVTALSASDPAEAARLLAAAAAHLRSAEDGTGGGDDEGDDDDDDLPVTKAELKAWEARQSEALAHEREERAIETQRESIRDEMKELGYDLDSKDPIERARASTLIELAQQDPEGSLQVAHKQLVDYEQSIIDKAMKGKRKEAARTTSPTGGSSPSGEKALETMEDGEAAMTARLDGAGIPARRRG